MIRSALLVLAVLSVARRRQRRTPALFARTAAIYGDGAAHASASPRPTRPPVSPRRAARRERWIQAPQRLRFDYTAEKKVFTYDAGEGRFFSPEDRQLTIRKLSEDDRRVCRSSF